MNNLYGWEAITPVIHKPASWIEQAEKVWKFRDRGVEMMLDHQIEWDEPLLDKLAEMAVMYEWANETERTANKARQIRGNGQKSQKGK